MGFTPRKKLKTISVSTISVGNSAVSYGVKFLILLQVSLEVSSECEHRRAALASTKVHVKIDLGTTPPPPPPPPPPNNDLRPGMTQDPSHSKLKVGGWI